jgi:hypothetical protein
MYYVGILFQAFNFLLGSFGWAGLVTFFSLWFFYHPLVNERLSLFSIGEG